MEDMDRFLKNLETNYFEIESYESGKLTIITSPELMYYIDYNLVFSSVRYINLPTAWLGCEMQEIQPTDGLLNYINEEPCRFLSVIIDGFQFHIGFATLKVVDMHHAKRRP